MRHSRSEQFEQAVAAGPSTKARRWSDVASDPNDPRALVERAEALRGAWRSPIADRLAFLEQRCREKRVLDIGCVAHDVGRMSSANWLHARLASVAASCVGVDVLEEGIAHMRSLGFDAVAHDLRDGPGELAARAPFDVVVAGELIEHVEALDMLFRTAAWALDTDGEMILTTPNPYAPHRVRAARLGIVWENVDHIMYAFPSGIAELCERHGLVLAEAATTVQRGPRDLRGMAKAVKRRVLGRQWMTVGVASIGGRRLRRVGFGPIRSALRLMRLPRHRFTGETFVYVIRRPQG
jgi:2-polyprenyl-3-methyl-5-hydroxy-6-metoxy-1,4-benzoquinol methylase